MRNLRLKITCKSLSILVIISGICQGLEIEGITVATLQMTYQSMTNPRSFAFITAVMPGSNADICGREIAAADGKERDGQGL